MFSPGHWGLGLQAAAAEACSRGQSRLLTNRRTGKDLQFRQPPYCKLTPAMNILTGLRPGAAGGGGVPHDRLRGAGAVRAGLRPRCPGQRERGPRLCVRHRGVIARVGAESAAADCSED